MTKKRMIRGKKKHTCPCNKLTFCSAILCYTIIFDETTVTIVANSAFREDWNRFAIHLTNLAFFTHNRKQDFCVQFLVEWACKCNTRAECENESNSQAQQRSCHQSENAR